MPLEVWHLRLSLMVRYELCHSIRGEIPFCLSWYQHGDCFDDSMRHDISLWVGTHAIALTQMVTVKDRISQTSCQTSVSQHEARTLFLWSSSRVSTFFSLSGWESPWLWQFERSSLFMVMLHSVQSRSGTGSSNFKVEETLWLTFQGVSRTKQGELKLTSTKCAQLWTRTDAWASLPFQFPVTFHGPRAGRSSNWTWNCPGKQQNLCHIYCRRTKCRRGCASPEICWTDSSQSLISWTMWWRQMRVGCIAMIQNWRTSPVHGWQRGNRDLWRSRGPGQLASCC